MNFDTPPAKNDSEKKETGPMHGPLQPVAQALEDAQRINQMPFRGFATLRQLRDSLNQALENTKSSYQREIAQLESIAKEFGTSQSDAIESRRKEIRYIDDIEKKRVIAGFYDTENRDEKNAIMKQYPELFIGISDYKG
jgi:uncharacterized coiled-coil protein SlyX